MYKILEVEDKIRVVPAKFSLELNDAVKSSLSDKWEGIVDRSMGVVLAVVSLEDIGEGKILPGDGAIHYPAKFKLMVYQPEIHEVVTGEVIDVTEFGAFVRIGPVDGMIHVSQLMSDFVTFDEKNGYFIGRESKRKLNKGDTVVVRIVSVSMEKDQYKIGLTARQAGLGEVNWIEEDKKRGKRAAAAPEKKELKEVKGGKDKKKGGKR
ncbi:MAG TPA: DNA-directed RNA polymerase [archaeon]|nr:DNA-directed RNA polymerase [archaeon]